eukprot:6273979-Ditylum_brightwellii.AAC.1
MSWSCPMAAWVSYEINWFILQFVVMKTEVYVGEFEEWEGMCGVRRGIMDDCSGNLESEEMVSNVLGCVPWVASEEVDNAQISSELLGRDIYGVSQRGAKRKDLKVGLVKDKGESIGCVVGGKRCVDMSSGDGGALGDDNVGPGGRMRCTQLARGGESP